MFMNVIHSNRTGSTKKIIKTKSTFYRQNCLFLRSYITIYKSIWFNFFFIFSKSMPHKHILPFINTIRTISGSSFDEMPHSAHTPCVAHEEDINFTISIL